jgi:hypothetical protein
VSFGDSREEEDRMMENYYGGKPMHCWACGAKYFGSIRLESLSGFWLFRWGRKVLRLTCDRCQAVTFCRPGTIQPARSTHSGIWIRT